MAKTSPTKKKSQKSKKETVMSLSNGDESCGIRERLILRAFDLFSERGFHYVSLEDVAAAENVTKGCIYGYFASKQELMIATCSHFYRSWQEKAFLTIALGSSPRDSLERFIRFSVECCISDRKNRIFTTEVCAFSLHNQEIHNSWTQFSCPARDMFFGLASAAVSKGEMQIRNIHQSVEWLYSTFQGVKIRAVIEPNFGDSNRLDQVVRFLMNQLEIDII